MSTEQQHPSPTPSTPPLHFRPPSSSPAKPPHAFTAPSLSFLSGIWHVSHSTLPMWNSNRNVTITYTPHPDIPGAWDNLVKYQPVGSEKWKTVKGIEKPDAVIPAAWDWRGKGWLMVASSHWEVLGWGEDDDEGGGSGGWCVVWFEKTIFTPAGVDLLVKRKGGVGEGLLARLKKELGAVEDEVLAEMVGRLFAVRHDGGIETVGRLGTEDADVVGSEV